MSFEVTPIISNMWGNAYLLTGDHIALVDTSHSRCYRKLLKVIHSKGVEPSDIEFVLITHSHFDHCGNLAKIKALSGAQVIAGEGEVPIIEGRQKTAHPSDLSRFGKVLQKLPRFVLEDWRSSEPASVDRPMEGGEIIGELGLEVLALPGHTPGGLGFLDRNGRRAFLGDIVSNWFGRLSMPYLFASESIEKILESHELLAGLDLETAYPSHGRVITTNASKAISEFVAKQRVKRK